MINKFIKSFLSPRKTKIAVLIGGPSSEHEVSLWSGKMVTKHLNRKKYEVRPITISKENKWPVKIEKLAQDFDLVFIAMHGEYGEDGQIQALLEKQNLPYTGSSSKVSKLAIDKVKTSNLLTKKGLACPPFIFFKKEAPRAAWFKIAKLGLPLVVKPINLGSSVGVNIVREINQLAPAINKTLRHSNNVMVQKYIEGKEVTCSVLDISDNKKRKLIALPPTEIILLASKFFDYKAKYTPGASKEITPPNLPEKTVKAIQKTALLAHQTIGCSGYSRVDMILDKNGQIYILEVNTLPGLTKTSLLPQAAKKAGIDFSSLLDIIINNARD